jgi:homoserine dehydrogenase
MSGIFPGTPLKTFLQKMRTMYLKIRRSRWFAETIGGVGIAYEFTKRALSRGKSVVTSNKELVARHGVELMQLASMNHCIYLFEASVGGGIPIIRRFTAVLRQTASRRLRRLSTEPPIISLRR